MEKNVFDTRIEIKKKDTRKYWNEWKQLLHNC